MGLWEVSLRLGGGFGVSSNPNHAGIPRPSTVSVLLQVFPGSLYCVWWHCCGFAQGSSVLGMAAVQGQSHGDAVLPAWHSVHSPSTACQCQLCAVRSPALGRCRSFSYSPGCCGDHGARYHFFHCFPGWGPFRAGCFPCLLPYLCVAGLWPGCWSCSASEQLWGCWGAVLSQPGGLRAQGCSSFVGSIVLQHCAGAASPGAVQSAGELPCS